MRLLTDEELAALFCRMFALTAGTVPIVLNVDVPDSALTAAFQAAGAALAAIYLPCPGPGDAPEHRAAIREAVGFAIKGVLIATGRTPDPYRGLAVPEGQGQVFLTIGPGRRLYLRDGHLARFALMVTVPDQADDADRLAAVGAADERVQLGEGAPFGYIPIVLPDAPADLTGLAVYAVPWLTATRHYSVARPPHSGRGARPGFACPGLAGLARDWSRPRRQTAPPRTPVAVVHPPPPPPVVGRGQDGQQGAPPRDQGAFPLAPPPPPPPLSLSHFRRSAATRR